MPRNPLLAALLKKRVTGKVNASPDLEQERLKRAPRFDESINVEAKHPEYGDPFPDNIDEIYLGTKTSPPTGTYTPPADSEPHNNVWDAARNAEVKKAFENYPFAKRFVSSVNAYNMPDSITGETETGPNFGMKSRITMNDTVDLNRFRSGLLHEFTHATQRGRFPDFAESMAEYLGPGRLRQGVTDNFERYKRRSGEEVARAVQAAVLRKQGK